MDLICYEIEVISSNERRKPLIHVNGKQQKPSIYLDLGLESRLKMTETRRR